MSEWVGGWVAGWVLFLFLLCELFFGFFVVCVCVCVVAGCFAVLLSYAVFFTTVPALFHAHVVCSSVVRVD